MNQAETLDGITTEQYWSNKSNAADIQALNTKIFYDIIGQKSIPATSIFADQVSNYDLVVHRIKYTSLQRVDVPNNPIPCNFTTLQKMSHLLRSAFGNSKATYSE